LRSQVVRRLLPVVMAVLLAGTAAACNGSDAKTTYQPKDYDSAKALAKVVSKQAGCGSVEDSSLPTPDHWNFSCQFGKGSTFDIRTAISSQVRDAARPSGFPYVLGDFYLVVPLGPGSPDKTVPAGPGAMDIEHLKDFPGQHVTS